MLEILRVAFRRKAVNIETAWLILLGIVICGFSMPFFGIGWDIPFGDYILTVWWFSFSQILTIAVAATVMSTIIIYGYEVWYIYYLTHDEDFKFVTRIYEKLYKDRICSLEEEIMYEERKYKEREELKFKLREQLL
jgi:hypothetical protein